MERYYDFSVLIFMLFLMTKLMKRCYNTGVFDPFDFYGIFLGYCDSVFVYIYMNQLFSTIDFFLYIKRI